MAVVYKALQPALRRYVAVKVLLPELANATGFRARFQEEAETVARLDHPHILAIHDYGQSAEGSYIVMPLITGGTLREWLGQSQPLEGALAVFSQILDAVQYAHTRQPPIVHRDIKPTNIMMRDGAWPLLADFGLARILEPSARGRQGGNVAGTPEYMAPELCRALPADHRSDLYALGIMLYKVLAGRVPFQGPNPTDVMTQQVNELVPSVRTFNPELSPIWDDVVQRCLAKNPDERYPSAKAMDEAIRVAWRQTAQAVAAPHTVGSPNLSQLQTLARRALSEQNWPRAISLCSEILAINPVHTATLELLAHAHEGLHRQAATLQGQAGVDLRQQLIATLQATAAPAGPAPAVLTVQRGAEPGRTYDLDGSAVRLGRGDDNAVQIKDAAMSRHHCEIRWQDSHYVVQDLGSSNGTFLNGNKVSEAPLSNGDVIRTGGQVFKFTLGARASTEDPEHTESGVAPIQDSQVDGAAQSRRAQP
jgi:hypothetical protein